MKAPRIVLASSSPRRRDILRQLGIEPEVRPADVDESYASGETPAQYTERLARLKAQAVAREVHDVARGAPQPTDARGTGGAPLIVVGGDTVVVEGDTVLGKPRDREDAVRMLLSVSGTEHQVLSGMALACGGETVSGVARTGVRMRSFDEATARAYVSTGEPMDKAGSYGIQGQGAALVAEIEGDYYSVVGFPVGLFLDLLETVGWRFTFGSFTPTR